MTNTVAPDTIDATQAPVATPAIPVTEQVDDKQVRPEEGTLTS